MNYKYQRRQIFGKKLKVPKYILVKVYDCTLSLYEFIEYGLEDKIPVSCIIETDRQIVEKFGIEKCKKLDWELINKRFYYNTDIDFKELFMRIDSQSVDINLALYELVKNQIKPSDYSLNMKERYSDRFFDVSEDERIEYFASRFHDGKVNLKEMICNWDLFWEKDLSYCLLHDEANKNNITDYALKKFMDCYGILVPCIVDNYDIYTVIHEITMLTSEEEKQKYMAHITDDILKHDSRRSSRQLTDEMYQEIFKYSSMADYLKSFHEYDAGNVIDELKTLPQDYVFKMPIPFSMLLNRDVLSFVGRFGLKNVVDFDNECGQFFTKKNYEMLNLMGDMYLHYAENENDRQKNIYCDKDGNYIRGRFTKDQFYEAMRRMIVYGPSNWNFLDKAPDYRDITGEFRIRNAQLFISEQAPEELQKLFYTKSITPQLLIEHPEYIEYLNGKDLSSCFRLREVPVEDGMASYHYENFYRFLGSKTDFAGVIDFIIAYSDILDIIFDREVVDCYLYKIKFSLKDDISCIQKRIHESFRRILIEKRLPYPKIIPQSLRDDYPMMFLNDDAPCALQEAFYNRNLNSEDILSNPFYKKYLKMVDLEILFPCMFVDILDDKHRQINLVCAIQQVFGDADGFDVMLLYGKYMSSVFDINHLCHFQFNPNFSKDELLNQLDQNILEMIIAGKIKYDETIPSHFKNNHPTLFLSQDVPQEIRNKFYRREFSLYDFHSNPTLLEIFGNTNIVCGFSESFAWIILLFQDLEHAKTANYNRLKVISAYSKIQDVILQEAFKDYMLESGDSIDIRKVEYVSDVLLKLGLSNSSEIFMFRKALAMQILNSKDPFGILNEVEDVFIRNNIPTVGKIYSCFELLHPDFQGFDFEYSMISPILKKASITNKKKIIFSDLIKSSFGSNNRSVNAYLKNIKIGFHLYECIKSGQVPYEMIGEERQRELMIFCRHLVTLYHNTMKAKKENDLFVPTEDVLTDIFELSKRLSPDGTVDYNLGDRVIRMFCGFIGIDTLEQAEEYIHKKIKETDERNRRSMDLVLEQGDFIKGIGDITYLTNILQNGSVSKEYLGSSAGVDATPLDTDVSMIMSSEGTIHDKISATAASNYGPIWFVLKNDDRFITTRNDSKTFYEKKDTSKMEVFYTGVRGRDHYGIRTGFASSEINYIIVEQYDSRVGLEIAMNGFYIPVVNKEGKIVFTPNDYDKFRKEMSGLSYYGEEDYVFSDNLVMEEVEPFIGQMEQSHCETQVKRLKINQIMEKALGELGLQFKTNMDGDFTEGSVEFIDIGSTGRGTNEPGAGDFDFMMRLDRTILSDSLQSTHLRQVILKNLGKENLFEVTRDGDFRLKNVQMDGETCIDIDITFTEKTDQITYSTDMALQDRLATIQRVDSEKYKYVIGNILLAKHVLKQAGVYKPNRGKAPQGGLGGVGIENWILQNGGSFMDAARNFVRASEGKSFSEFQTGYSIWDFGSNYLAARRGQYSHDNFVTSNMNEIGYQNMVQALKGYLDSMEMNQIDMEVVRK